MATKRKSSSLPKRPTASELVADFEEGHRLDIAEKARDYSEAALATIHGLSKGAESETVQLRAATTIIEIAHGKAATQPPAKPDDANITIVINQLTSDEQLERVVSGAVTTAKSVIQPPIDVTPKDD
jgi:hypothetical protein